MLVPSAEPSARVNPRIIARHSVCPQPPTRAGTLRGRRLRFRFKAIGKATGFQCKLKRAHHRKPKAVFRKCSSPKRYKRLKTGKYSFKVRAKGPGGTDPTPARKKFRIKQG